MVLLLTPLFRYSDPRRAWILRGIGETRGPVLQADTTGTPLPAPGDGKGAVVWPPLVPSRRRRVASRAALGLALIVVLIGIITAVVAFTLGHGRATAGNLPPLNRQASSGPLALAFPASWQTGAVPRGLAVALSDPVAITDPGRAGGTLVVGRAAASTPSLLPPSLLRSLPSPPSGRIVTLGHAQLYRYLNLSPRGGPRAETLYALSTTTGVVLGVCVSRAALPSFVGACERSLGTLRLSSGSVLPPGPIPGYAASLSAAIRRLDAVRAQVGSRLFTASGSRAQAQAADALAGAHTAAAAALRHLSAGPASTANAGVAGALALDGAAYHALARAAANANVTGYDQARARLRRAATALQASYLRLSAFGYRVS